MTALLTHVGRMKIEYTRHNVDQMDPHRKGDVLFMPRLPQRSKSPTVWWLLREGTQALFGLRGRAWLVGTDTVGGRSFLIELKPEALTIFRLRGEEAFYRALKPPITNKPPIIRRAEALWGEGGTYRYGDVFVYVLPSIPNPLRRKCWVLEGVHIFQTRHRFSGAMLTRTSVCLEELGSLNLSHTRSRGVFIGEGRLEVAGLSDVRLEGFHIVEQAVVEQAKTLLVLTRLAC